MGRTFMHWFWGIALLATLPSSSNYQLHNYAFGSGGVPSSSSTNYKANGTAGEITATDASDGTYGGNPGHNNTQQANVPGAPTLTNPANYYDKLQVILNTSGNPTDAKYLIAISPNGFGSTYYVQPDDTISPTLNTSDYQTYAAWGGSSGQNVIGLQPSTTYTIKVKSTTGEYTESAFGPTASAATVAPSMTFKIDVSATNQTTSPPYAVNFGSLVPGSITSSPVYIWNSFTTNADNGGSVYVTSATGGLHSTAANYTIGAMTGDLSSASIGEGAQGVSVTQTSGGPLALASPYNGSAQVVGILDSVLRPVFTSAAPITSGRGQLVLKAKITSTTPAANDYQDALTMVAAASF